MGMMRTDRFCFGSLRIKQVQMHPRAKLRLGYNDDVHTTACSLCSDSAATACSLSGDKRRSEKLCISSAIEVNKTKRKGQVAARRGVITEGKQDVLVDEMAARYDCIDHPLPGRPKWSQDPP